MLLSIRSAYLVMVRETRDSKSKKRVLIWRRTKLGPHPPRSLHLDPPLPLHPASPYPTPGTTYHLLLGIETNRNVAMFSTHLKTDIISIYFISDQEYTVWAVRAVLRLRITAFLASTLLLSNLKTTSKKKSHKWSVEISTFFAIVNHFFLSSAIKSPVSKFLPKRLVPVLEKASRLLGVRWPQQTGFQTKKMYSCWAERPWKETLNQ